VKNAAANLPYVLVALIVAGAVLFLAPLQSVAVVNNSSEALQGVVVRSSCGRTEVVELPPGDSVRHWIGWCGQDSTTYIEFTLRGDHYRGTAGYFGKIMSRTLEVSVTDESVAVWSGLLVPSPARTESFSMASWTRESETRAPELPPR
jgi:hypothetical protein